MPPIPIREDLILGLDLGANSVGWALIQTKDGAPCAILAAGTRVFEAGVDGLETGKSESRNADRRNARGRRRLLARRDMRLTHIRRLLQRAGLLPPGEPPSQPGKDKGPLAELLSLESWDNPKKNPYKLRARALDESLAPFELGRALYHLAHRRGFQSNRKTDARNEKDDEKSKVYAAIKATGEAMEASHARTFGEYLSKLNPHESRLRGRYTHRDWFKHEFDEIWKAQAPHHPGALTPDFQKALHRAFFYQRPLKTQTSLIGECELEKGRKRAPMALLLAQRVRLLQEVNHARVVEPGRWEGRKLSNEEARKLIAALERSHKVTFAEAKRLLGWAKGVRFNLEEGGREELKGNTTAARLIEIFGERWDTFTPAERDQIVEDLLSFENDDALARRGQRRWGLDDAQAKRFAGLGLEDGYSRHSRQALAKLLPHLAEGLSYAEAKAAARYVEPKPEPVDSLPPAENLRNPIVQRALAETRKVVNLLVKKHGKPGMIRIELARELKKNAKQREAIWKRNKENEKERQGAASAILAETDNANPSRGDTEKLILWEECNRQCPYTGRTISINQLFSDAVDIEHIIPFSRSLDNSFLNKTLCFADENRQRKRNKTPWEAYGDTPQWEEIIERIKAFGTRSAENRPKRGGRRGESRSPKLDRFMLKDAKDVEAFLADFSQAQLNNTGYATRKAREYLALFYGGDWRKRTATTNGQITGYLRSQWNLNSILTDGPGKTREDHRHHAVDAIVTALCDAGMVKALSDAAANPAAKPGRIPKDGVPMPWESFRVDAEEAINGIIVSHRVNRKVNGPLHKDSFYGLIQGEKANGKAEPRAVIRTRLDALTPPDIKKGLIVDPRIRAAVHAKLAELAGAASADDLASLSDEAIKKAVKRFAEQDAHSKLFPHHPTLATKDGRAIPIHKVRVFQSVEPEAIGEGARERLVKLGSNHHLEIFATKDKKGAESWRGEIVSRIEAVRRQRKGEPVYRRQDADGNALVFSLMIGDAVELDWKGARVVAIVGKLSQNEYAFRLHNDARKAEAVKKDCFWAKGANPFRKMKPIKIAIQPDGGKGGVESDAGSDS